uniref:Uncharacterized protein n=1 Tax=Anguilla anguilla TaxID=7936 RepID=A0A0E9R898_ANGAN
MPLSEVGLRVHRSARNKFHLSINVAPSTWKAGA